jgi:hypothetical protein
MLVLEWAVADEHEQEQEQEQEKDSNWKLLQFHLLSRE